MAKAAGSVYHPLVKVVTINPRVQGGVPCFTGTRVPVESLFDHLKRGYTVEQFLEDFPTVQRFQVDAVLELAKSDIPAHADSPRMGRCSPSRPRTASRP